MADTLTFQLNLIDKMTAPAKAASRSVAQLEAQLKAEQASIRQLNAAMKNLQGGTSVNIAEFKKLQSALAGKKELVAGIQSQILSMGGASKKTGGFLRKIWDEALWRKDIDVVELAKLGVKGLAGAAGLAADAVLSLGRGIASLVIGGASLAIEASDAKNDTLDMLDAMLGTQEAARDAYSKIEGLTSQVAISQDRALELAQQLTASGISNTDRLTAAIKGIAQVDTILKGGGEKIQALIERALTAGKFDVNAKKLTGTGIQIKALYEQIAKQTGIGVKEVEGQLKAGKISAETGIDALNAVIQNRFGDMAKKQLLDLPNQLQKLRSDFTKLFEDVNTDGFLSGLHEILDLFDQSTVAGDALHKVITMAFNGLFEVANDVLPYVKTLFKGLVIIGLQLYIALKPVAKQLTALGDTRSGTQKLADAMTSVGAGLATVIRWATYLGGFKIALEAVAVVVGVIATGLGLVALAGILLIAPFYLVGAAVLYVLNLLWDLVTWGLKAGTQLVDGLINGITGGTARLVKAVKTLAGDALTAFKNTFSIHSPSRVMHGMGTNLVLGLTGGLDDNAHLAERSMSSVVAPPRVREVAQSAGKSSGSGTVSVTFSEGAFQISGVKDAEHLADILPDVMANAFEKMGIINGSSARPQAA